MSQEKRKEINWLNESSALDIFDLLIRQIQVAHTLDGRAQAAALQRASKLAQLVKRKATMDDLSKLSLRIGKLVIEDQPTGKLVLQTLNRTASRKKPDRKNG